MSSERTKRIADISCSRFFFLGNLRDTYLTKKFFAVYGTRRFITVHLKVKQSRYRPGMAQRVPGNEGSQIS
jgi:hypothetical protein